MNPYLAAILTMLFIAVWVAIGTALSVMYQNPWILVAFVLSYCFTYLAILFRRLYKLDQEQQERNRNR